MKTDKNIYFASDFHLGSPTYEKSLGREKQVVLWLESIKDKASEIFLVGDVFDFWFEYKHVIPKGFVRLQGKIAELTDSGIKIHLFKGNHDMWIFDYLPKELGIELHDHVIQREFFGKKYLIGHGDGLGPGDFKYKFLKKIFRNKVCQWLFARLHPNFGIGLANLSSRKSRSATGKEDFLFNSIDDERLFHFCKEYLTTELVDYFIFGHRHLPLDIQIGETTRYINLGEWLFEQTFLEISNTGVEMFKFKDGKSTQFITLNNRKD
ncbi:MAG: UDP-2,3-diacylglucosamine diphosphatase [Bacteroidota bacterium]